MPLPGPGPIDQDQMHLPSVKITGKFWDDGPFGRKPTWMQLIIKCHVEHLDQSNYLNHYLEIRYQIVDAHYVFWPNPSLPENDEPWFEYKDWYCPSSVNGIELGEGDEKVVVWNFMVPAGATRDNFRTYQGVKVKAILYGGNGPDFGIEELHEMASDVRQYELDHTMFGSPENPADHAPAPPEGIIINDS